MLSDCGPRLYYSRGGEPTPAATIPAGSASGTGPEHMHFSASTSARAAARRSYQAVIGILGKLQSVRRDRVRRSRDQLIEIVTFLVAAMPMWLVAMMVMT